MTRRFVLQLAAVVAIGLALRVGYVLVIGDRFELGFDARWYQLQAGTLAGGEGYVDPDAFYRLGRSEPTANFPPLWPTVLAVVERLGLEGDRAFQLVGAVIGSVTVGLTAVLARRIVSDRVALVAAAFVALSPMAIAADGSLMSESLSVALLTLATLLAYEASARPSFDRFALLGAVLGVAALTRSDALVYAPLLALAAGLGVRQVSRARRAGLVAACLGVTVALMVPWTVRNTLAFDEPVLASTNSASVLEGANCASTYSGELLGAWDASCLVETRRPGASETEWAAAARRAGIDYATDHAARLPLVASARVLRTWGLWDPIGQTELDAVESRHERWQQAAWVYDFVVLGLAVAGAVLLVRRRVQLGPLVALVAGVCLTALLSTGMQRLRLPAMPALAIAAATAAIAGYDRLRSRA